MTASSDGTAKVWSMLTGNVLRTLRGHVGVVYAAVFTPEGQVRGMYINFQFWRL